MPHPAHALLMATGRVNPLSIGWHSAFWTEGPRFTALGLGNGAAVSSWPDEKNSNDLSQATVARRPSLTSAHASFNNRPAIALDGSDDYMESAVFTDEAQPNTIVLIGRTNDNLTNQTWFGGSTVGKRNNIITNPTNYAIFAGTSRSGGTPNTAAHLLIVTFDTTAVLEVDGTTVISDTFGAGVEKLAAIRVGSNAGLTTFLSGAMAFVGFHAGTLTAAEKADLLAFSRTHYGTP